MPRASTAIDVLARLAPSPLEPRRNEAGQVLDRPNVTAAGQRYRCSRIVTPTVTLIALARRLAISRRLG